jgi:hypothetical protein
MRGAPLAVVTALVLVGAACGAGPSTAHGTPSTAATVGSTTGLSTTATVSFGSPVPATPTARRTAPAPPGTSAALATRSPAPTSPPGTCTAGDVSITTTTTTPTGPRYGSGETVNVKVVVHNLSARGCLFTAPGNFAIEHDPSGEAVYAVHLGCPATGCEPLDPHVGTLTYPVPWTHQIANQGQYANQQAPNGAYHARAAFTGYPVSTSAPFTIG